MCPKNGNGAAERSGVQVLRGVAEGAVIVQSGQKGAQRPPYHSVQLA